MQEEGSDLHQTGSGEHEVHFLGVETHQTDDGQNINIGSMTVDNVQVALVDIDDDQVFDVRIADINDNGEVDEGEVSDISEAGLTVQDFMELSQQEQDMDGSMEQAMNQQEDLAPDMPDYMNDASTDLI